MKKLFCILLALTLVFTLAACTQKPAPNPTPPAATETPKTEVLKVGMECAYAPFNYTLVGNTEGGAKIDGGGFAGGYDVEIAKLIAKDLGRELLIVKTEWDGLLPALTSGKIDLIIAGMSPTAERKETIDFSENYYSSDLVVVVKKDGPYANAKTINDFAKAKITGQLNTFHYTVIDQMKDVAKQPAMEDFPTMIVALTSGKIDGYISERPGASSASAYNPALSYIEFSKEGNFTYDEDDASIACGIKKGSALTAKVNEAIKKITGAQRETLMAEAVEKQPAE